MTHDTPTISDALERHGLAGAAPGLAAVTVARPLEGRVVTVQLGPVEGAARPARHLCTAAIDASGTGDVIVVANGGRIDCAGWGGLLSLAAHRRGIAGVIVDGACRDVDEAAALGLPVYARAAVPVTARGRVAEVSWGEPVEVCGVAVRTGDRVFADGSGVVFVPAARAHDVLAGAGEIAAREAALAAAIRAGSPVSEVMGASYESLVRGR